MIARHRLRGRGRFAAVRTDGTRAATRTVRVTVAGNGGGDARVGFALPGLRSAVERNRLRRRLREAVRPLLAELTGFDLVVGAGAEAAQLSVDVLRAELTSATIRAVQRARGSSGGATADNAGMSSRSTPATS